MKKVAIAFIAVVVLAGCTPSPEDFKVIIAQGDTNTVTLAISRGSDLNAPARDWHPWGVKGPVATHTPLTAAIEFQQDHLVPILLDAGAKIEVVDGFGNTPLLAAVSCGSINIVTLLIERGADINARNKNAGMFDRNAIDTALSGKDLSMIDLLLDHGAVLPDDVFRRNCCTTDKVFKSKLEQYLTDRKAQQPAAQVQSEGAPSD